MNRSRSFVIFLVLALGFVSVLARAIQLQVKPSEKLEKLAENKKNWGQKKNEGKMIRSRGSILDRYGNELAMSLISKSFFANPRLIENPDGVSKKIAPHLKLSSREVKKLLEQDRFFVWLEREVAENKARKIENLEILGVQYSKESKRIYPHGETGRAVLGIAGRDGIGLEGVEKIYDSWLLTSDEAENLGFRDAMGRLLLFKDYDRQWFEAFDVQLTLDWRIQKLVEEELKRTIKETQALGGQAILMNPQNGEILAMASVEGNRKDDAKLRNRSVSDIYEPGSTFKIFTALAGLEKLHLSPSSQLFAENGSFRVGVNNVREFNYKKYGWLSLEEMLTLSSNIAASKVGLKLGAESLEEVLLRLGFGEKTGIDLPGEASGIIRSAKDWKPIDLANISFGQGVAVTPIQMIRAVAAIANGGYLVKPHVVSKIVREGPDKMSVWEAPIERKEVLGAQQTRLLTQMLNRVTEEGGTGSKAAMPGYQVAGKTGTSQKLVEQELSSGKKRKVYSTEKSIVSFVGYVPAEDPAFVLLVIYDEPKASAGSGGYTAAPSFRRIASQTLGLMGRAPRAELSKIKPSSSSKSSHFVGKSFQDVLTEIRQWDQEKRERVELIGFGKATREENDDEKIRIYFE